MPLMFMSQPPQILSWKGSRSGWILNSFCGSAPGWIAMAGLGFIPCADFGGLWFWRLVANRLIGFRNLGIGFLFLASFLLPFLLAFCAVSVLPFFILLMALVLGLVKRFLLLLFLFPPEWWWIHFLVIGIVRRIDPWIWERALQVLFGLGLNFSWIVIMIRVESDLLFSLFITWYYFLHYRNHFFNFLIIWQWTIAWKLLSIYS